MPVYTVHAPVANDRDFRATDRFTFVRDGFHLWAAVFGMVWLAWHRLWLALSLPAADLAKLTASVGEANGFRVIFFVLTFFSIGVLSNFRKLWEEGLGKLAAVYVVCLFGFVIWFGLLISWLFFHGVKPPLAG